MSSATHLPPERMSGRASLASSRISAAVSSTSSNTADQRTSASWLAPTAVSFDSANSRSDRRGLAGRQLGDAHVEAGVGEARAGDRHQLPRLVLAEDGVAAPVGAGAQQRGEHALEPGDVRARGRSAWSGRRRWRARRARAPCPWSHRGDLATNTSRSHTPVRSGGSRRTISGACSRVTERDHCSARDTSSPATRAGASNALPSRRARNASVTSLPVRTTGGAAGTSMRRALSRPMASTMPVSAERVTARASTLGSSAATLPGMASTTSARRSGSTSVGVQRTAYDAWSPREEPLRRRRWRSTGHHRAACRELDRPHRDLAQPAHARADVVAHVAGTRGDQPAEHLADRRADRRGLVAAGDVHLGVRGPRCRGRFGRGQELGDLVGGGGADSRAHRPRRRPGPVPTRAGGARRRARRPRARRVGWRGPALPGLALLAGTRGAGRRGRRSPVRRSSASVRIGGGTRRRRRPGRAPRREAAGRDEVLVGVDEEAQQRGAPRRLVGVEDVELLGRREVVGLELDVEVEGRVVDALASGCRWWSCC